MAAPNHKDILREQRTILAKQIDGRPNCPPDLIIALALVTLALDVDYLTENLHRVGEGI